MQIVHDNSFGPDGGCMSPERLAASAKAAAHSALLDTGFGTLAELMTHAQGGGATGEFRIAEALYADPALQPAWGEGAGGGAAAPLCLQKINPRTGEPEWNFRTGVSNDPTGAAASTQMYARGAVVSEAEIFVRVDPQEGERLYWPARPTARDVRDDTDFNTQLRGKPLRLTVRTSKVRPRNFAPARPAPPVPPPFPAPPAEQGTRVQWCGAGGRKCGAEEVSCDVPSHVSDPISPIPPLLQYPQKGERPAGVGYAIAKLALHGAAVDE